MNVQAITEMAIRGSPGAGPTPAESQGAKAVPGKPTEPLAPAEAAPKAEPTVEELARALEGMNAFVGDNNSHIQFAMHQEAQRMMVQVVNNETHEVIKTMPSKELLDLAAKIGEMVGMLLDKKG